MIYGDILTITPVIIDDTHAGQRLDNFLIARFKGVPSTRIYRAIRKGEVRVNKRRVRADYRLQRDDAVRVPPLRMAKAKPKPVPNAQLLVALEMRILTENNDLLIIDKPSGLPVHGGTGVHLGLIEALRVMRPQARFLELVHRLDRGTSGCLIVAKKRRVLVALHDLLTRQQLVD